MNLLWSLVRKTCHWEHTSTLTLSPVLSFILLSRSDFSQQNLACIFLCPCVIVQLAQAVQYIIIGLSIRLNHCCTFDVICLQVSTIWKHPQQARVKEWGKVQWIDDSDAGDLDHSSGLMKPTANHWDVTFVQVSCPFLLISEHSWLEQSVHDVSWLICAYTPSETRVQAADLLWSTWASVSYHLHLFQCTGRSSKSNNPC